MHISVWLYYGLFIHSLVDKHLCCFQFLAVTSKATMSICVQVFVWVRFHLSHVNTRSGMAGSHGRYTFNSLNKLKFFKETAEVSVIFYIQISTEGECQFFHILTNIWYGQSLSHSNRSAVLTHFDLICTFLVTNQAKHLFMCLSDSYIFSLGKCLHKSSAHF